MSEEHIVMHVDALQQRLPQSSVLDPEKYASEIGAEFLLILLNVKCDELKEKKQELIQAKAELSTLRQDHLALSVKVAQLDESIKASWLEAAFGLIGGAGFTLLIGNVRDPLGWSLLALGLVLIGVTLGGRYLRSKRRGTGARDNTDA